MVLFHKHGVAYYQKEFSQMSVRLESSIKTIHDEKGLDSFHKNHLQEFLLTLIERVIGFEKHIENITLHLSQDKNILSSFRQHTLFDTFSRTLSQEEKDSQDTLLNMRKLPETCGVLTAHFNELKEELMRNDLPNKAGRLQQYIKEDRRQENDETFLEHVRSELVDLDKQLHVYNNKLEMIKDASQLLARIAKTYEDHIDVVKAAIQSELKPEEKFMHNFRSWLVNE